MPSEHASTRLQATIPRQIYEKLAQLARAESTTVSAVARRVLTDGVLGRPRSALPTPLRPILLSVFEYLPYEEVVYLLLLHGEVVFIGRTDSLDQRVRAHRTDKEFDRVYYVKQFPPEHTSLDVEQALIAHYKPRLNKPSTYEGDWRFLVELGFWEHQPWAADP